MDKHNVHKYVICCNHPSYVSLIKCKWQNSMASVYRVVIRTHIFSSMVSQLPPLKDYKKMLKVSTVSFNARCSTSEQWLSYPLDNPSCRTNDLKFITYPPLLVLDIIDFCSMNSRLQMFPEIKVCEIEVMGKWRPWCWSISTYPLFQKLSRMHAVQEENVVQFHQA
jgi:hypothetical protein